MAQADNQTITVRVSELFRDPYLRAVFARAEDDGTAPQSVNVDNSPTLSGGAAASVPTNGPRLVYELM